MFNWLTTKVALYACAALLVTIAALSATLWVRGVQLQSARNDAKQWHIAADEWAKAARKYKEAGLTWRSASKSLETKLAHANRENLRVKTENAAAVAKLEAQRVDAERTLKDFMGRFANKTPTCAQALNQMEAVCSDLSDY